MSMTRKDFELVARVLAECPLIPAQRESVVFRMSQAFTSAYFNFDCIKFRMRALSHPAQYTKKISKPDGDFE